MQERAGVGERAAALDDGRSRRAGAELCHPGGGDRGRPGLAAVEPRVPRVAAELDERGRLGGAGTAVAGFAATAGVAASAAVVGVGGGIDARGAARANLRAGRAGANARAAGFTDRTGVAARSAVGAVAL